MTTDTITDEQRFRASDGLSQLTERGLYWGLDAHCTPARAYAETPPGQPHQRIEIRDENHYRAALRLFDAVSAADLRATKPQLARPATMQLAMTGVAP